MNDDDPKRLVDAPEAAPKALREGLARRVVRDPPAGARERVRARLEDSFRQVEAEVSDDDGKATG